MRTTLIVALLAFSACPAAAQEQGRANPGSTAPAVQHPSDAGIMTTRRPVGRVDKGDRAPDFELQSADGPRVRLSKLRGGWVAMCFCGHGEALADADSLARSMPDVHFAVVAVSGQRVQSLHKWANARGSHIVLLADPTNDVAALYGMIDPEHDIPRLGFVLVDPTGIVHTCVQGRRLPPAEASRIVQYAVTGS